MPDTTSNTQSGGKPHSPNHTHTLCQSSSSRYHPSHHNDETQPLLNKSNNKQNHNVSKWKFWDSQSDSFRFFVIILVTLMPMGPHIMKYALTSLSSELMHDKRLNLTYTQLGSFQSAISIPSLLLPFLGGIMLDVKGSRFGTIIVFTICLIGQILFTIACWIGSYRFALLSRIIYGFGQGTTVVAQGRLAAHWFVGRELVFAVAMTEASHDVAQWLAKVYPVPMKHYFGSYIAALVAGSVFCAISLGIAIVYFYYISGLVPHHEMTMSADGHVHTRKYKISQKQRRKQIQTNTVDQMGSEYGDMMLTLEQATSLLDPRRFTFRFFVLCMLHLLFANSFHLFSYVSVIYMEQVYHYETKTAAWISSISSITGIFLCPIAGYIVDRIGYKMYICTAAGIITCIAYLLLAWIQQYYIPVIVMLMLSLCISFVPTVLRSSVPNLVHPSLYGTAYGFYEVSEAAGHVAGNALVGYVRDVTGSYQIDLYIFSGMAGVAGILSFLLSILDNARGGVLNLPSHTTDPHADVRCEEVIGTALSGVPVDHEKLHDDVHFDSDDKKRPHAHHKHHNDDDTPAHHKHLHVEHESIFDPQHKHHDNHGDKPHDNNTHTQRSKNIRITIQS